MINAMLRREWLLLWRRPQDMLQPITLLLLLILVFPMALDLTQFSLPSLGWPVLLNAVLLSLLLGMEQLFAEDQRTGYLDQVRMSYGLYAYVLIKLVCHWLRVWLPLVVVLPLVIFFYQMPLSALPVLLLALSLASAAVVVFAAFAAALTLGLARAGMLMALLVLPLLVPVLVFAAATGQAVLMVEPWQGAILWLAAITCLAWSLLPWAISSVLELANH